MNPIDPIDLLAALIETKSYSGEEAGVADVLEERMKRAGASPRRIGNNVICEKGRGKRTFLFNSHLDTVPASSAWTRDPWNAAIEADRIFGLGATDAKSCVAALAVAFLETPDPGERGRLIFTATTEEESGGMGKPNGIETVLPQLGPLHAGIVGEPTKLNICNGQRGLVRIILHAEGQAGHASRPWEGVNAIEIAAADVLAIKKLGMQVGEDFPDPAAGKPTIQSTIIAGGTAANVIPDRCDVTLDIRTTRDWNNSVAIAHIREHVKSTVEVKSKRFLPVSTDVSDPLIQIAQQILPQAEVRPFGGVSDLYFLTTLPGGPIPCFLLGPGDGRQSHQPDEFVSIQMVRRAVGVYREIVERWIQCSA